MKKPKTNESCSALMARLDRLRALYFIPWAAARMIENTDQRISVADLVIAYDKMTADRCRKANTEVTCDGSE